MKAATRETIALTIVLMSKILSTCLSFDTTDIKPIDRQIIYTNRATTNPTQNERGTNETPRPRPPACPHLMRRTSRDVPPPACLPQRAAMAMTPRGRVRQCWNEARMDDPIADEMRNARRLLACFVSSAHPTPRGAGEHLRPANRREPMVRGSGENDDWRFCSCA